MADASHAHRSNALRFTRQTRLPEVGARGQARLADAHVRIVCVGRAGEIERAYLVAAGVGSVLENGADDEKSSQFPDEFAHLDPAARDVARGAFAALVSIRGILEAP